MDDSLGIRLARRPSHASVTVAFAAFPGEAPTEVWLLDLNDRIGEGAEWSDADLVDLVTGVAAASGTDTHPFVVRLTKGHTSWGASGGLGAELWVLISSVALDVTVGDATRAAVRATFRRIVTQLKVDADIPPMARDDLIAYARWRVAAAFDDLEDQSLVLIGEDRNLASGEQTFTFRAPDGQRFEVSLGVVDALPVTQRIVRYSG